MENKNENLYDIFKKYSYSQLQKLFKEAKTKDEAVTIIVSVNGKMRDKIEVGLDATKEEVEKKALESDKIKSFLNGAAIKKIIVVPGKIVNIVI